MTTKIDIRMIFYDHFLTFRDESTGDISYIDVFVMIFLPIVAACSAYLIGFSIRHIHVGTLISVFAIFAGLLFNVLVLIYGFSNKKDSEDDELRINLIRQTFANVSYSITMSLVSVVILSLLLFSRGNFSYLLSAAAVFASLSFLLSLMMVLKRVHVLLRNKFEG